MRNVTVLVAVVLAASVLVTADPGSQPSTQPSTKPATAPADPKTATLPAAIGEFVALLEKGDKDAVLERWAYGEKASADVQDSWDAMKKAHEKFNYRKWIDKAADAVDKYTVGGHGADHLHVVWTKTDEGWRISEVQHCR